MTTEHPVRHGMTLANRITILRILAVPVFILMLLYYTQGPRARPGPRKSTGSSPLRFSSPPP